MASPDRDRGRAAPAETDEPIFHLTTVEAWEGANAAGAYLLSTRGRTLGEVGFVHCGYRHQVLGVAERLYGDASELVLLVVDSSRLGSPVRAENLEGGDELFPHIYGELELEAVIETRPLRRDGDGRFRLPAGLI